MWNEIYLEDEWGKPLRHLDSLTKQFEEVGYLTSAFHFISISFQMKTISFNFPFGEKKQPANQQKNIYFLQFL